MKKIRFLLYLGIDSEVKIIITIISIKCETKEKVKSIFVFI